MLWLVPPLDRVAPRWVLELGGWGAEQEEAGEGRGPTFR